MNITYEVRYKEGLEISNPNGGALGDLVKFIKSQHQNDGEGSSSSGIIYVHRQKDTTELAQRISRDTGVKALPYHGGMKDTERLGVQEDWMLGRVPIAVATIAFGMGIDLGSVRYVVHWNMSKTVENFYQESGRAGRDGLPSTSLVYFSNEEASRFRYLASLKKKGAERATEALEKMSQYCLRPQCRRKYLLDFFGEAHTEPSSVCQKKCDYCKNPTGVSAAIEASSACSHFSFQTSSAPARDCEWDGQWSAPHGDDVVSDEEKEERLYDGLLVRMGDDFNGQKGLLNRAASNRGGSIATALEKYEKMESNDEQKTGFVKFRSSDNEDGRIEMDEIKAHRPVVVPEHLRKNAPNPLQHFEKKPLAEQKSSTDLAGEAARLREELAKLKAAREELNKPSTARRPPPPPPPNSMQIRPTKRKKR